MKLKIKVNLKKLISVLLCSILISSTISPITAFASNERSVSNLQELKIAIKDAKSYTTIYLTKDIEIPPNAENCDNVPLSITKKNITIEGKGNTIKMNPFLECESPLLFIGDNATLNLNNVVIDCSGYSGGCSAIEVTNCSTLNINYNSSICNCKDSSQGTINLSNSARLNIFEGYIYNCKSLSGGAIYSRDSLVYLYSNNSIHNCTATEDGGAIYSRNSSIFFKSNNSIHNCTAKRGDTIYSSNSKFHYESDNSIQNCENIKKGNIYIDDDTQDSQCNQTKPDEVTICNNCVDTNNKFAILEGRGTPGHDVIISTRIPFDPFDGSEKDTPIGYATVGSNGHWKVKTIDLSDGKYTLNIVQKNKSNIPSKPATANLTVETHKPTFKVGIAADGGEYNYYNNTEKNNTEKLHFKNFLNVTIKNIYPYKSEPYMFKYALTCADHNINDADKFVDCGCINRYLVAKRPNPLKIYSDDFPLESKDPYYYLHIAISDYCGNVGYFCSPQLFVTKKPNPTKKPNRVNIAEEISTNKSKPTISVDKEGSCRLKITMKDQKGNTIPTTITAKGNNWEISPNSNLSDGIYTIQSWNILNKISSDEATTKLIVDTKGPTGTIEINGILRKKDDNSPIYIAANDKSVPISANVKISAKDNLSGVKEIKYFLEKIANLATNKGYPSFAAIPKDAKWTTSHQNPCKFTITHNSDKNIYIWARLTDMLNNEGFLKSNLIEMFYKEDISYGEDVIV